MAASEKSLQDLREDYAKGSLDIGDVLPDPIEQFRKWFADAQAAKIHEPNGMTLATAMRDGAPSARIVLLKDVSADGFVFYTNYESRKGQELAENPRASLVFWWDPLERSVRIDGTVSRVGRATSKAYFDTRPQKSRIGASISKQGSVVPDRRGLEDEFAKLDAQYGEAVPLPDFWGGYLVRPTAIEFWQGRRSRVHDRLRYRRDAAGAWVIERLAP